MTNYQSGVAFRRALEDRLASQSAKTQTSFTAQGMGDLPPKLPAPPPAWALTFRKLAEAGGQRGHEFRWRK